MPGSLTPRSTSTEIADFLAEARSVPVPGVARGRLIFALDATMSRQPTWDMALSLQGRMFEAAAGVGGLDVQLVFFRGQGECLSSRFVSQGQGLADLMRGISVRGGITQWRRTLAHARDEARAARVGALVCIGDAMEEDAEELNGLAGELALVGVKAFMFQEGDDRRAQRAFQDIARLTGGAYGAFDAGAAARLATLLRAAAAYAAGGREALAALAAHETAARPLLEQMQG